MPFLNLETKEINCRIVYHGPGLSGKTTNLRYIHNKIFPPHLGKILSCSTKIERVLFFDFVPPNIPKMSDFFPIDIEGFTLRLHLYTAPSAIFNDPSRQLILEGVDGIVFVADSQIERMEANIESFEHLKVNLKANGFSLEDVPIVFQYNKSDLPNALPLEEMNSLLNTNNYHFFKGSAVSGQGVLKTFDALTELILARIRRT